MFLSLFSLLFLFRLLFCFEKMLQASSWKRKQTKKPPKWNWIRLTSDKCRSNAKPSKVVFWQNHWHYISIWSQQSQPKPTVLNATKTLCALNYQKLKALGGINKPICLCSRCVQRTAHHCGMSQTIDICTLFYFMLWFCFCMLRKQSTNFVFGSNWMFKTKVNWT